jgi:hypothetical protein
MRSYLDTLTLVERLHRLLLDVIKDEFERLGILDLRASNKTHLQRCVASPPYAWPGGSKP